MIVLPALRYLPDSDADLATVHTDGCDGAVGHAGPCATTGGRLQITEHTKLIHWIKIGHTWRTHIINHQVCYHTDTEDCSASKQKNVD